MKSILQILKIFRRNLKLKVFLLYLVVIKNGKKTLCACKHWWAGIIYPSYLMKCHLKLFLGEIVFDKNGACGPSIEERKNK